MPSKTKSFKASIDPLNPAMQFISTPPEPKAEISMPEEKPGKPPEGFKVNPLYVETKSRRLQLLLQPSLYEKMRAQAKADGVSVNELVHSLLEGSLSTSAK